MEQGLNRKVPNTLREFVRQRGQHAHNLWVCYSAKQNRELHLTSDYAMCHVVLLECDPEIVSYTLEAPEHCTQIAGKWVGTRFDATVIYKDGHQEWHEVKALRDFFDTRENDQIAAQMQIAEEYGTQYKLFTDEEIRPQLHRIWNGLLMLSCLSAAREHSLMPYRTVIIATLMAKPQPIGALRHLVDGDQGLLLAALFELVLQGHVLLDMDSKLLTDLDLCRYSRRES